MIGQDRKDAPEIQGAVVDVPWRGTAHRTRSMHATPDSQSFSWKKSGPQGIKVKARCFVPAGMDCGTISRRRGAMF